MSHDHVLANIYLFVLYVRYNNYAYLIAVQIHMEYSVFKVIHRTLHFDAKKLNYFMLHDHVLANYM